MSLFHIPASPISSHSDPSSHPPPLSPSPPIPHCWTGKRGTTELSPSSSPQAVPELLGEAETGGVIRPVADVGGGAEESAGCFLHCSTSQPDDRGKTWREWKRGAAKRMGEVGEEEEMEVK